MLTCLVTGRWSVGIEFDPNMDDSITQVGLYQYWSMYSQASLEGEMCSSDSVVDHVVRLAILARFGRLEWPDACSPLPLRAFYEVRERYERIL